MKQRKAVVRPLDYGWLNLLIKCKECEGELFRGKLPLTLDIITVLRRKILPKKCYHCGHKLLPVPFGEFDVKILEKDGGKLEKLPGSRKVFGVKPKALPSKLAQARNELVKLFDKVREKLKSALTQMEVFDALNYMDEELAKLKRKYSNKISMDEFWELNTMIKNYVRDIERYAKWKLRRAKGDRILAW